MCECKGKTIKKISFLFHSFMELMTILVGARRYCLPCQEGWAGINGSLDQSLQSWWLQSYWFFTLSFPISQNAQISASVFFFFFWNWNACVLEQLFSSIELLVVVTVWSLCLVMVCVVLKPSSCVFITSGSFAK